MYSKDNIYNQNTGSKGVQCTVHRSSPLMELIHDNDKLVQNSVADWQDTSQRMAKTSPSRSQSCYNHAEKRLGLHLAVRVVGEATVPGLHDEHDIDLYAFLLNEGVSALSQLRR